MCVRKDIGEVPPFTFTKEQMIPCSIDSILQDDAQLGAFDVGDGVCANQKALVNPDERRFMRGLLGEYLGGLSLCHSFKSIFG